MNSSAIYIHVPWCRRRCPYCDFYLVVGEPDRNFVDALCAEWEARSAAWQQPIADTLYFGGGTPSLLPPIEVNRLIGFLVDRKALKPQAEITLEINPEDVNARYADELIASGVNRVSVGVQSFDDRILRGLGRKHSSAMAKAALCELKRAGFSNISVDLIVGNISEDTHQIIESIHYIHDENIPHLSAYLLTIEEGTNFYQRIKKGVMQNPDEDAQVDIYRMVQKHMQTLGFTQYDISSYAQPGFTSRHNQVYWAQGSYVGLGPGAHSMRFLPDGGIMRASNQPVIAEWLKDPCSTKVFTYDQLDPLEALLESLAFGLRNMITGIRPKNLSDRHKTVLPASFFEAIKKHKELGWLDEVDGVLRISQEGALFADAIMREIILS